MRVLIYGHKGWIGGQFLDLLTADADIEVLYPTSRAEDLDGIERDVVEQQPTHVVSFIGRTHGVVSDGEFPTIDYLEQPGKLPENLRDNLFAPMALAMICHNNGVHYTYLGTGCIFDYEGDLQRPGFKEADIPNFTGSGYSSVKGVTDRLMHLLEDTVLNLRIRMPIVGKDNPRNFITKIAGYDKVCSIANSMTVLPELLPIALRMMKSKVLGTMNLTNPGRITHNEILMLYSQHVDPDFRWENFDIEEQNSILDSKRSNNLLNTERLVEFAPEVNDIQTAVTKIVKNYVRDPALLRKKTATDFPNVASTTLLVTGGCGFIGSNFINNIHSTHDAIKIINLDAMYYCANEKNVEERVRASGRYNLIKGNLQSYDLLRYIFQENNITHVVNFAAQSHVQSSFDDSLQYTRDNIMGTHNLLEVARLHCPTLQKFIHVSTDEVYGESMLDADEKHKTEQSVLCPTNPYAATKASAELIAQSYNHSFSMPIVISRGNNVYGPNQYPEKVIPRFIEQLKAGKPVTIQGDGSCVRAFLHSRDTATAFQCILERGKIGEIYNIGCDEGMEYSIRAVAEMLIRMVQGTDEYEKWITYIADRPFNDQRYYISNEKLRGLGWDITVDFNDGLAELVFACGT